MYIYICVYIYMYTYTYILMRLFREILLPSLGLIKHLNMFMMLWCVKFILLWTLNRQVKIYTIYICISVTHKVLKSCRSKMATWAHDVCDVHGASSLYIKICWQSSFYISICIIHVCESPTPNIYPLPAKSQSPHFKSYSPTKTSYLAVVIAPVSFLF